MPPYPGANISDPTLFPLLKGQLYSGETNPLLLGPQNPGFTSVQGTPKHLKRD